MDDDVVEALNQLVAALERNKARIDQAIERAAVLCEERRTGRSWKEILDDEGRPVVIAIIGENLDEIYTAGGRFRRVLAKQLYDEGLSMEQVARVFGVTRQRVSALLRGSEPIGPPAPALD